MNFKKFISVSVISVISTVAGIAMAEVYVGPSDTPDNYNVKPPINVSIADQIKVGSLGLPNLIIGADVIFKGSANAGGSKVGIGTTSPSKKLDVAGDINFTGDLYKNGVLLTTGKFVDGTDTDDAVYTAGNVGIGTTSPSAKLDVSGVTETIGLDFSNNIGSHLEKDGSLYRYSGQAYLTVDDNLYIRDMNGSTKFHFETNNGRFGIGTTSPAQKLDVVGDIQSTGWVRVKGSQGIYFQDHGGGWHMSDNSWIRSYGSKNVYVNTMLRADGGFQVDGKTAISGDNASHSVSYPSNSHYGYFNGYRSDGKRGYYLGWGDGGNLTTLYLDYADTLNVLGGDDAELDDAHSGFLMMGDINSTNLVIDNNEIMARNNGSTSWLYIQSNGGHAKFGDNVYADEFLHNSDRRLKKNIIKLDNYKDILKIDAVRFDWKEDGRHDIGIIAQEVQKYFPEFVFEDDRGMLSVNYGKLSVPMLNLLQEQEERLNKQKKEIQKLKEAIKKLQK